MINEAIYGGREQVLSREEYAAYEAQIRKPRPAENPSEKKAKNEEGAV